ncbi:hypothetical protein CKO12_07870 [Chromatium okenii]|uniref:hybrid sensor histidine kinase/response regulator n=1 Tax=Chromatium okenii TaxID=61644 RepID=UPI0019080A74|nr:hybrid sensor histidine kinase/response regulator [Chromatium okenii]MBK1641784.1 hypothetical protein [Chromatium okenii]
MTTLAAFAAVFYPAIPALRHAVVVAGAATATPEERLIAANAFAELLGELWPAAEAAGAHLTELLTVIDSFVSDLPHREPAGAETIILELLALLDASLAAPQEPELVRAMVELASSAAFDPPLGAEAVALWEKSWQLSVDSFQDEQLLVPDACQRADADCEPTTDNCDNSEPLLTADALELLAILAAAAADNSQDFLDHLADLAHAPHSDARSVAIAASREMLGRFTEASADAGLTAFAALCRSLSDQFAAQAPETAWSQALLDDLTHLLERMHDYFAAPLAEAPRRALVATLTHPAWTQPLAADCAAELITALYQDPLRLDSDAAPPRATQIDPADVALTPADDVDASVLAGFCREGVDLTQRLATVIQVILGGGVIEDALRQAQRYAHTLKGSANVCGIRAVAVLGHHLEDVLEFLTAHDLAPSPALGDTLLAAADGLAMMFDVLNGIEQHAPATFQPLMQQVLDWVCRLEQEGSAALVAAPAVASAPESASVSRSESAPITLSAALDAPLAPASAQLAANDEAVLQIPAATIDNLLRLVGELALALSQSETQLTLAQRTVRDTSEVTLRHLLQITALEQRVDLRGLHRTAGDAAPVDPLELEHYDELLIAARQLNESVNDTRDLAQTLDATISDLDELNRQQLKLSHELRQLTLGTRLVPVQSIVGRLQRAVRQICRATGKDAVLIVQGDAVRIDSDVLERLLPALMHIVRNAIDHGIELPAQRRAVGKPAQGELTVLFQQLGDQIVVTCRDDGAGVAWERIRAKARASGLLTTAAELTPQELLALTLRPGFSTREHVTHISGRGVGMDVVATTIRSLNGTLALESTTGSGYQLRARVPTSLLTIHCLLIHCQGAPLAVPANDVRYAVLAAEGDRTASASGWQFHHADATYPLLHLNSLLGLPAPPLESSPGVVLVLTSEHGDHAILVDALLDNRELLIKPLGALVPASPGVLAASILGDGRVVPIIDLRTLLDFTHTAPLATAPTAALIVPLAVPTVLIVDDSLSMRHLLAQLVTDGGYRALTARDGMDALQTLRHERVDVLLVDMEMPQMNGLELTAHLRAHSATSQLPIAMITSRSTARHRHEALRVGVNQYFIKPYHDEAVLDFIQQALDNTMRSQRTPMP